MSRTCRSSRPRSSAEGVFVGAQGRRPASVLHSAHRDTTCNEASMPDDRVVELRESLTRLRETGALMSDDRVGLDSDGPQPRWTLADAAALAELQDAPRLPPKPRLAPRVLLDRALGAAHSPRQLRRVLALAEEPLPGTWRRMEAIAAEARRRGTIPPPSRVRLPHLRGRGPARRPRCTRRTSSSSTSSAADPPDDGEHRALAGESARAVGEAEGPRAPRGVDRQPRQIGAAPPMVVTAPHTFPRRRGRRRCRP